MRVDLRLRVGATHYASFRRQRSLWTSWRRTSAGRPRREAHRPRRREVDARCAAGRKGPGHPPNGVRAFLDEREAAAPKETA
jgi:hypothetical protein